MRRLPWLLIALLIGAPLIAAEDTRPDAGPGRHDDPKRQVERVMNAGLPFVERMLATRGEFAPFGAVMLREGLIQNLQTDSASDASAEQIFQGLMKGLIRGVVSGEYKAVGVFAMVEMRQPDGMGTQSAVHVALEHSEGYCVDVYYPVVLRGDSLVLDEPFAGKRSGTFFNTCS